MSLLAEYLPPLWSWARLGEICSIQYGKSLPAGDRDSRGQYPVYGSAGVVGRHDEVLSGGPSIIIGRKGSVGAVHYCPGGFWAIDTTYFLESVHESVDLEYLSHALQFFDLERYRIVVGVPGLNRSDLEAFRFPLPPISEQQRIKEVFLEWGRLNKLRREAADLTSTLFRALFSARFSNGEAAQVAPLSSMAEIVSGVALGRQIRGSGVQEVPYLRVANVQAGRLDLTEIKTTRASEREIEAFSLRSGDVLMTEGGDYDKLGRGCLWSGEIDTCIHQNHVFRVRPDSAQLRSRFFAEYLQSAEAKHYFLRCAKRTTNLASINLTQLKALPVPVVSLNEQERFEKEVELAASLSSDRADSLFCELRESLRSRAFAGALTRGWRERNVATVRQEATERDRIFSAGVGADNAPPTQYIRAIGETHTQISTNAVLTVRPPRVFDVVPHLNSDQRQVLRALESLSERSGEAAPEAGIHQTAGDIARAIRGNLRNDVQAVEGCLKVLDALGLVVSVSRPQREPATNATVFGTCYRLPARGDDSQSGELETETAAQDVRGEAIAVLAAARDPT